MKKLIIIAALAAGAACLTGCKESNRCDLPNRNHTFTKAIVVYGNTNVVYDVVAWRDYTDGEIQLWVKDEASPRGHKVILTHFSRVILENPAPEYDPKF